MAKKLNTVQVNMTFSANTAQAKAQVQDLQAQLNSLTRNTHLNLGVEEEIRGAIAATAELSAHLQKATNIDTGNLDFAKLNQSLKASGKTLQEYGLQLQKLGPQGQQAFLTLAQSIASAEIPLKRTNLLVKEFWTTLQNTARWQLSSSVLHGFMGAIQSAYGYAQDLNESLNNIRIVTNRNTDEMAKFAKEANKAAKALSATTTEYTNASLIYYQQGLSDKQVKERADVTVKLANVSRQSAEEVSDQMTSIWNNFYNGSKSLEYYADVMTALGAATASSTEEIAGGLEKFAAVADTIGLSYEYAAAALATITSNTRQSEEVVGTALKTIFARIQGLNLGETLEDGTTLNKYSEALDKVGVNIYDANMQLKDMDTILNELGGKWNSLGKDQQVALAQTVAGVRQYNQLIALMDNWNKGDNDSFIANLNTANAAAGSLQQQADIYAESWEAAADRVTAAAESLYDKLINDEFFIDLLNNVEKVLSFIDQIIDGLGGLQGVLLALGTVVTKVFATQISQGLTTLSYNLQMSTEKGRQKIYEERKKFIKDAQDAIPASNEYTTDVEKAQKNQLESSLILQSEYLDKVERMSELEKIHTKQLMDRAQILRDQNVSYEKQIENIGMLIDKNKHFIMGDIALNNENAGIDSREAWRNGPGAEIEKIKEYAKLQSNINLDAHSMTTAFSQDINTGQKILEQYKQTVKEVYETVKIKNPPKELEQAFEKLNNANTVEEAEQAIEELNVELEKLIQQSNTEIKRVVSPEAEKNVDELTESLRKKAEVEALNAKTTREAAKAQEDASKAIKNAQGAQKTWSDIFVASTNAALSLASALQMAASWGETLTNPELTTWQKFTTLLTTTAMLLGTIVNLIQTLKTVFNLETVAKLANAAATWAQVAAEKAHEDSSNKEAQATAENTKKTNKNTLSKMVDTWNKNAWDKTDDKVKNKYIEQLLREKGYTPTSSGNGWKLGSGKDAAKAAGDGLSNADAAKLVEGDATKLAGKSAFKGLLTKLGGVALIAAGVMIAAATVKGISDYIHKAEKELEKTKQIAAELNNHYSEMVSKHNEFTQSLSNYKSAQDGLKGLVKGTQEYQDAVVKANNEAMALLETNKNLKYEIVDGVITIDEGSLMSAQQQAQNDLVNAQAAKFAGQQNVMLAEENIARRDYARSVDSGEGPDGNILGGAAVGGAAAGAAIAGGAALLAASGPIGWAIAAIGLIVGGAIGVAVGAAVDDTVGQESKAENDAINKIAKAYQQDSSILGKSAEDISKELEINDTELVNALMSNKEEFTDLMEEMKANTAAINAQNDLIAAQMLSDNAAVTGSEYQDEVVDITGDIYGNILKDISLELSGWGVSTNKESQKSAFQDYLTAAGLDNAGYTFSKVEGKGDEAFYEYVDKDGNTKKISVAAMRAVVASSRAMESSKDYANQLVYNFNQLAKQSDALLAFASKKSFNSIIGSVWEQFSEDNPVINEDVLKQLFNVDNLDELAKLYGYESATEFINAFKLAFEQQPQNRADAQSKLGFSKDSMSYVSVDAAAALLNTSDTMNQSLLHNKQGQNIFTTKIEEIINNAGFENDIQKSQAFDKISKINWNEYDAAYEIIDIITGLGGTVNETNLGFKEWASTMNVISRSMFDYGQLLSDLTAINKLLNELNLGDIISEEDYLRLAKYNKELANYFTILSDGSAQLIGDPLELIRNASYTISETLADAVDAFDKNDRAYEARLQVDQKVKQSGYDRSGLMSVAGYTTEAQAAYTENEPNFWHWVWGAIAYSGAAGTPIDHGQSMDSYAEEAANTVHHPAVPAQYMPNDGLYRAQIEFLQNQGIESVPVNGTSQSLMWFLNNNTQDNANAIAAAVKAQLEASPEVTDEFMKQYEDSKFEVQVEQAKWEAENASLLQNESFEARKDLYDAGTISLVAYSEAVERAITAEKWDNIDVQQVKDYADTIIYLGNAAQEAADKIALFSIKALTGFEALTDGISEWYYMLKNADENSLAFTQSFTEISTALSDLFGVDEDFITKDFIIDNLDLIYDLVNGVNTDTSFETLQERLSNSITNGFGQGAKNGFAALREAFLSESYGVGDVIDKNNGTLIEQLQTYAKTYDLTPEQIAALASSLGYDIAFSKVDEEKITTTVDENGEETVSTNTVQVIELDENGVPVIDYLTKVTNGETVSTTSLDKALDDLTKAMVLKLEIDEKDLELIDYKLNAIKDDFYSMTEGIQLLLGNTSLNEKGELIADPNSKLGIYNSEYATLWSAASEIRSKDLTPEQFRNEMGRVYDATLKSVQGLRELDNTMMSYYGETLKKASEELKKYTTLMDHHNTVLDHYKNLITLINGENDFESLNTILRGRAAVASDQAAVSRANYNSLKDEEKYWYDQMNAADITEEAKALYTKNWTEAKNAAAAAQDEMLNDLNAWAEAEKEILKNTLADLANSLEESLTGGISFDEWSEQMERASSLQEEYLTTTNQIYETTKLMRTAQSEIDASTNTIAKNKLKNFITETKALQEQGQLSKFELSMQQAKYDLLVAEMALEEAQNAKNTVRLQRDSEGNFGYVYTADSKAVNEAQQQFDDAQNALYNKGLEGANDYAEKYQATMAEMYDTFKEIQENYMNGSYENEEEYNNAMMAAKQYYYAKLSEYSSLYTFAMGSDSNIVQDAWSFAFKNMVEDTSSWKNDVETYLTDSYTAFENWADALSTIKTQSGLDNLSSAVTTITTESTTLKTTLIGADGNGGVVAALDAEYNSVNNLVTAYGQYRDVIQEVIDKYDLFLEEMNGELKLGEPLTISTTTTVSGTTNVGTGAATGGYTAAWGPEGKLLMVHEKELILNKDQTESFFDNLAIMENILATIDSYAIGQQLGGFLTSPNYNGNHSEVLEQSVHIEASFPGVTDRNEIEEAFNNLVNKASQYANRK